MNAIIFDVDGTLIDSNEAHIEAWRRAFNKLGYDLTRSQIRQEIGKGGDLLIPSLISDEGERKHGDELRELHGQAFLDIVRERPLGVFPGVRELTRELRRLRVPRALATSSKRAHLEATLESARIDLLSAFDLTVTSEDIPATKPAPDLVTVATTLLGVKPFRTVMVGDTRFDGIAALRAGAGFIGLTCGGTPLELLLRVGAREVYADPAELCEHLRSVLEIRSSELPAGASA